MSRLLFVLGLVLVIPLGSAHPQSPDQRPGPSGHYLFAWAGDAEGKGNDFLAVIDADPASPNYGKLVTTVVTDQPTKAVHHTEYTMPASGMLFANDHFAGRTFIFGLRDPLHPKIATSFTDMAGYMHPHSFVRLPNGHVLSSFQHAHQHESSDPATAGGLYIPSPGRGAACPPLWGTISFRACWPSTGLWCWTSPTVQSRWRLPA